MVQVAIPFFCLFFIFSIIYMGINKYHPIDKLLISTYTFIFFVFVIFFYGFRDPSLGTDTEMYSHYFNSLSDLSFQKAIIFNRFELGFSSISYFFAIFGDATLYFVGIAFLQCSLFIWMARKTFDRKLYILFILALLSMPFYANLSANIIRQGLALPLVLMAVINLANDQRRNFVLFILIASLFHYSALIFLVLMPLYKKNWPLKIYVAGWLLVSLLSAFDFFQNVIYLVIDFLGHGDNFNALFYQSKLEHYKTGFRFDFFAFSLMPFLMLFLTTTLLGWRLAFKAYEIFKLYAVMNAIFIAILFAPHSDRVGIYSWMLIPVFCVIFCSREGDEKKFRASLDRSRLMFTATYIFFFGLLGYLFLPLMKISPFFI